MRDYKEFYREAKGQRTRIYVDMDGVIADFMTAAKKATGMTFTQSDSSKHFHIYKFMLLLKNVIFHFECNSIFSNLLYKFKT